LFLGCASSWVLFAAPAIAAKLENWRFDTRQNQLEFTTDTDVQPKAQLVNDPTRLVIDLPGIVLGRPVVNETMSGTVRSVRIGQFDRETTRIVIELVPGYTLDPAQIKFRGLSPRQWAVRLPAPQPIPGYVAPSPTPEANSPVVVPTQPLSSGSSPTLNRLSWPLRPLPNQAQASPRLAVVEAVELEGNGTQLSIRANQPVRYSSRWDRSTGAYRIEIANAQLASQVKGPQLESTSSVRRLTLRQETAQTVVILVQPAAGVQVGQVSQPNQQLLILQLQRSLASQPPLRPSLPLRAPTKGYPNTTPGSGAAVPPQAWSQTPNSRLLVVIDPGHGGPDPGAVGIGGLQEKGIVLDIGTKVAALLQQQGVQTLLTRSDDRDLDLEPRVQMAEQANATVFVSIHANAISLSRTDISGLETYYYQSGQELAQTIHQTILQGVGISDRGVRTARFYVLRKTSMPSVLVEVGFVTGQDDAARLSNPAYRTQMATAIARGILQYLQRTARR
jgi:N-acetylmuramoyl-L-alanine amidase